MKPSWMGAHLPWHRVADGLERMISLGLAPEIALKGPQFDQLDHGLVARVAGRLAEQNLRPTIHAPFFDLNPGALDPLIRQVTRRRLDQALDLAGRLNAHLMVVHPGYDRWRYPGLADAWVDLAAEFFPPLLEAAAQADCRLAVENIYEHRPDTLVALVERVDSAWFGHCFDVGHWHLFGKAPLDDWFAAIGPRLLHLHLHDNHGRADDHLPVGSGSIDFARLNAAVERLPAPPSVTLEAHSEEDLQTSLQAFSTYRQGMGPL